MYRQRKKKKIFDKNFLRCFLNRKTEALLARIGILCENKQKEKIYSFGEKLPVPV